MIVSREVGAIRQKYFHGSPVQNRKVGDAPTRNAVFVESLYCAVGEQSPSSQEVMSHIRIEYRHNQPGKFGGTWKTNQNRILWNHTFRVFQIDSGSSGKLNPENPTMQQRGDPV